MQSSSGQQIVARAGFFGLLPITPPTPSSIGNARRSNLPPRYRELVENYYQAPFNFYFDSSSDRLDNKALQDMDTLGVFLTKKPHRDHAIALAGFADSTGNRSENQLLSESRAGSVAAVLRAKGIPVRLTMGFGQDLPIRDNHYEDGRQKNRRVEIFISRR